MVENDPDVLRVNLAAMAVDLDALDEQAVRP
jgi:hypothetical protein